MNTVQKILFGMGIFYIVLGGCLSIIFIRIGFGVFVLIPLLFFVLGIAFVVGVCVSSAKKKRILKHGHRYAAKIYSYVENTAYLVNGSYTVNIKVHYFDENHVEREAIIPTGFEKGSGMYPIGMTIDIFEYQGEFSFDPESVRNETLFGEAELMDDKPVSPEQIRLIAVECPNCGSSFQAMTGYSNKCPYCGGYLNA